MLIFVLFVFYLFDWSFVRMFSSGILCFVSKACSFAWVRSLRLVFLNFWLLFFCLLCLLLLEIYFEFLFYCLNCLSLGMGCSILFEIVVLIRRRVCFGWCICCLFWNCLWWCFCDCIWVCLLWLKMCIDIGWVFGVLLVVWLLYMCVKKVKF